MTQVNFITQRTPFKVELLPKPDKVDLIVFDFFCGFGGMGAGFEEVVDEEGDRQIVVAVGINHYENAIRSHMLNHPETNHFIEDVRTVEIEILLLILEAYKKVYKNAKFMIWASAPCQEHSIAKAGQPLDVDNRSLPNDIVRYIEILKPDRVGIENVRLFKDWGPLKAVGIKTHMDVEYPYTELKTHVSKKDKIERLTYKIDPERKGEFFKRWRKEICALGYKEDWTFINVADIGGYTSRDRLFGQFCDLSLGISWPVKTHDKYGRDGLPKWKSAKDIIDQEDLGESIFNRKKRLSENTISKILEEMKKTLKKGDDWHIHKYYGSGLNMSGKDDPIGTLRQKDCMYYIKFLFHNYGSSFSTSLHTAVPTIQTNPKAETVSYIFDGAYGGSISDLGRPVKTIVASQHKQPLEKLDVLIGLFDTDISNFLLPSDIEYIDSGAGIRSKYLDMVEFCVRNGIRDVFKRGLNLQELFRAQGFREDYKYFGTQTEAKMFIGNSVSPVASKELGKVFCLN